MCRLLGYSSTNPTTFGEVVGDNFKQFVKLADDHCDGWGIAASGETARAYKEPVAATKSATFKDQLASHKSKAALLHLRWATPGMAINEVNTHPFTYQDISFIHIEISFTDTAVRKGGFSIFPHWHEIEMNNGMKDRFTFTVQNGGEWMLLMKVVRSELSKR